MRIAKLSLRAAREQISSRHAGAHGQGWSRPVSWLVPLVLWAGMLAGAQGVSAGVEASNVRLVGHSDLQGRPALQVTLRGAYAYVGHHRGTARNPLTGEIEPNGTTILDVSDPTAPSIVNHLPGRDGAESRAVQVLYGWRDGRDYLLRNQEATGFTGFEVWDITDRRSPSLIAEIGGLRQAHKGWWDRSTGHAFLSGVWPGWKGRHLIIYDLSDPGAPRFVANWGLPGQAPGELGRGTGLHHPVVDGDRAYLSYLFGGDVVVLDVADVSRPRPVAHVQFLPQPARSHTTVPYRVPRRSTAGERDPSTERLLVVSEEALGGECNGRPAQLYVLRADDEAQPALLGTFQVPRADFCSRSGRFGPHQFAETRDGRLIDGTLVYLAYFNAGLRIVDLSEPSRPAEVGFYVPDSSADRPVQTNDVDLDYRGLIYITDRSGGGLHVLEFLPRDG